MNTGGQYKENFFNRILGEYKRSNADAKAAGVRAPGIPILTESSLRLEQPITAATTVYTFPVLAGEVAGGATTVLGTETRLQTNDNFHVREVGIYLAQLVAATDTDFRLHTYPNEVELVAAPAITYHQLYNGSMNISVNQVNVLTNYRISKHYMVPQTQRLSVAAAQNRDQINLEEDGLIELAPSIMLSGAYTNNIQVSIPGAITGAIAGNLTRIVIIFDGLRAQNAALRK
jgi:hypothetical protein